VAPREGLVVTTFELKTVAIDLASRRVCETDLLEEEVP